MILSDSADERTAEDSDHIRPVGKPYFYSSPGHLRASAHLYGVKTVPLEKARVLELGCSTGGNLLPFALTYPSAQAVGIDLSAEAVQIGQQIVQSLGVTNLRLLAMDFAGVGSDFGVFDYIIVHETLSWVPSRVRGQIMRICRENLSADGIAYISHNTYPGWKAGETVRDAMLLHSHAAANDEERLGSAKAMLQLLSEGLASRNPQATQVQRAIEQLREHADYYDTIHDYLDVLGSPRYFVEFANSVQQAGLTYVGDAEPQTELSVTHGRNVQLNHSLTALGQPKAVRQQYLDFCVGRELRKSLFVQSERGAEILSNPDLARLADLRWACGYWRVALEKAAYAVKATYRDRRGWQFTLEDSLEISIVDTLSYAWPATLTFQSLVLATEDITAGPNEQDHAKAVQQSMASLFRLGVLRYSLDASPYDRADSQALALVPGFLGLVQSDTPALQKAVRFNLWHEEMAMDLDNVETALLSAFNGKSDFHQIASLYRKLRAAKTEAPDGLPLPDDAAKDDSRHRLTRLIDLLRRQGALIGSASAWVAYFKIAIDANAGRGLDSLDYLGPLVSHIVPSRQGGLALAKLGAGAIKVRGKQALSQAKGPTPAEKDHVLQLINRKDYKQVEPLTRELTGKFPRDAFGWRMWGLALRELGREGEALESWFKAFACDAEIASVYYGLGVTLENKGKTADAELCFRWALKFDSDYAFAWNALGKQLLEQEKVLDAQACFHHAIKSKLGYVDANANLAFISLGQGLMDDAVARYQKGLVVQPDNFPLRSNLLFTLTHHEAIKPAELFAEHRAFGLRVEQSVKDIPVCAHANTREPGRKLRVGFVSGDLWNHAVASFLEPVWRLLDKEAFDILAYSTNAGEDAVSTRLRAYTKEWIQARRMNDAELAERIRADRVDILFDLSGHTGKNRLPMFALKPAPVQVSWIGYPATTGLRAMDYYLVDKHFAPPGLLDDQFTERLVYLPVVGTFEPEPRSPEINELPALAAGNFTFGSFNRLSKINEGVFDLWARVLRAVPDSRLFLSNVVGSTARDRITDQFVKREVEAERLMLHDRTTLRVYLGLHHQVDLLLDTFPYTGGTTTNHGLWMGLPTLTLAGQTLPGRQGSALMAQVGLDEFVAQTRDEYVDKAIVWSQKLSELAAIRSGMRSRILASTMRSQELVVHGLEAAMRQMWQAWCEGKAPCGFEVKI